MKNILKGYIFSRPFMGERVPQGIQNLFLREYCKKKNYHFHLSSVEYCMKDSFIHLNNLINNLKAFHGIVAYSLFQLPQNPNERNKLLLKVLNKKKKLHFALEDIIVDNPETIEKVNDIWSIKETISN